MNVASLKKDFRSGWESQTENLDSITTLEAQVRFKDVELQELKHEIAALRVQKNSQINELKEQVQEYTDLYNQARSAQMELQVFKLKQADINKL